MCIEIERRFLIKNNDWEKLISHKTNIIQGYLSTYSECWIVRIRSENNLFNWVPQANMKIFHSQQDELVPIENSEIAYTNFILNGAPRVDFEFGPFGTHQNAAPIILIGAATWFAEFKKEGIEIPFPQRDLNIKGDSNSSIKKRVAVKKVYTK